MGFFLYIDVFCQFFFPLQVLSSPSAKFREVCKNGCTTNASAVYKMVNQSHLKLINNLVAKKKVFYALFSFFFSPIISINCQGWRRRSGSICSPDIWSSRRSRCQERNNFLSHGLKFKNLIHFTPK